MQKNSKVKYQGFTLVEIIVAIFIFAIIMAIISNVVYGVFSAYTRLALQSEKLNQIQFALLILEKDISQIVNRPIFNDEGNIEVGLSASNFSNVKLAFTRMGFVNPGSVSNHSSFLRVVYMIEGDKLVRRVWYTLDRVPNSEATDETLLEGVSDFSISIIDKNNSYIVPESLEQFTDKNWPKAIYITMQVKGIGNIMRIIILPGW